MKGCDKLRTVHAEEALAQAAALDRYCADNRRRDSLAVKDEYLNQSLTAPPRYSTITAIFDATSVKYVVGYDYRWEDKHGLSLPMGGSSKTPTLSDPKCLGQQQGSWWIIWWFKRQLLPLGGLIYHWDTNAGGSYSPAGIL